MSRLSGLVLNAAKTIHPDNRHSGRKVWIDDVHSVLCSQTGSRINLDVFKTALVSDPDCRMILARCDMPFISPDRAEASNTVYIPSMGSPQVVFNFVVIPLDDDELAKIAKQHRDIAACLLGSSACQALRSSLLS